MKGFPLGLCVVCGDGNCVRIVLRKCRHIVCVSCSVLYLQLEIQTRSHVAVKCPFRTCAKEVHENDINALLDVEEEGLNEFMGVDERAWLQYIHNKDSIVVALAGKNPENQANFVRRCPLCKAIYTYRDGCHDVICVNIRCLTRFCWHCTTPIDSMDHFSEGRCAVGYNDFDRHMVIIRTAVKLPFVVVYLFCPLVVLFFVIIFPWAIGLSVPVFIARNVYKKATQTTIWLTPEEKTLLVFKMITYVILSLPIGVIFGFSSLVTSFFFIWAYFIFLSIKMCPCSDKLLLKYEKFIPFAKKFGMGNYKTMMKQARKNKELQKDVLQEQLEREEAEQMKLRVYEPGVHV